MFKRIKSSLMMSAWVLTASASVALAQNTLYQHDFSGDGSAPLTGSAPDIDNNGGTNVWTGGANFKNDGTLTDPNLDGGSYLPFVPIDGNIYTLEANVPTSTVTADSNGWIGIGFRTSATGNHGNGGYAWYIIRDRDGPTNDQTSLLGPGAGSFVHEDAVDPTQPIDVKIILDTTTAGANNWTAEFFLNGVSRRLDTLALGDPSLITHVGVSYDELPGSATISTIGSVGSFQLSTNAPLVVAGDVNGDLVVDENDYFIIRDNLYETEINGLPVLRADGDLITDGIVNLDDFRQWKSNATPAALVAAGFAVPEPSSIAVLAIGMACVGLFRRRNA